MTISLYQVSVPVFLARLDALSHILAKAEANAAERKIDPQVFLIDRLAPDMLTLTRQVLIATDHAKGAGARLAGRDVPRFEDTETTFSDLQARISKTADFLKSIPASEIDGMEDRHISIKVGPRELSFSASQYLLGFAMPNFYFHITMAYAILRHNGVPLGKLDFFGQSA